MTYKELEKLVLTLAPAEAARLVCALVCKLGNSPAADSAHANAGHEVRDLTAFYSFEGGQYAMEAQVRLLMERLAHLPPERQAEVRDFIEFLHQQELTQSIAKDFLLASENAFVSVWDNDDDALYDKL